MQDELNSNPKSHIFPVFIPSFPAKCETQPLTDLEMKRIVLPIIHSAHSTNKDERKQDTHRKKVVAQTDQWRSLTQEYFTADMQRSLLSDILHKKTHANNTAVDILIEHIKTKISGYKSQDTMKMKYSAEQFVSLEDTVSLLVESGLKCYYCREDVKLFYEYVRDPKQWSLERMNNEQGHNRENLVIACLTCNIRRRTMHQERYVATKQMRVRKLHHE
jgi:hypothetical protein